MRWILCMRQIIGVVNMVDFKKILEQTQFDVNHIKIAKDVISDFLKTKDGIDLHNEVKEYMNDTDNEKDDVDF